jgi:hypothetical protein
MRALFGRYRVALYRWLLRLVDDGALAEDLLSEVFLDVSRRAASFEARSSVSTWLLSACAFVLDQINETVNRIVSADKLRIPRDPQCSIRWDNGPRPSRQASRALALAR